jgi:glutathione synthase/RimK-type ligase-like ATP-grasp enzyme
MILLWGIVGDEPMDMVRLALERRGSRYVFLDQQQTADTRMDLEVGERVCGRLAAPGIEIDLEGVRGVYLRPYDSRRMRAFERAAAGSPLRLHTFGLEDALLSWVEVTPSLVLNRPSAMSSNNSKPYQSEFLHSAGLRVPETLVTTDVAAAIGFWERHGEIIYKSVSGVRSIVSRITDIHRTRLNDIANCPTQLQQYVAGNDWRVHVVGSELFACEIISDADDYRYAGRTGSTAEIRRGDLPPEVACCCLKIADSLRLPLCGIDLRRTPAGEWYGFEANPSPAFSFYETATGLPIADAVARLLVGD